MRRAADGVAVRSQTVTGASPTAPSAQPARGVQLVVGMRRRLSTGRKRTTRPRGMPTGPPVRGFRATPVLRGATWKDAEPPEHHAVPALEGRAQAFEQGLHRLPHR